MPDLKDTDLQRITRGVARNKEKVAENAWRKLPLPGQFQDARPQILILSPAQ